MGSLLLLLELHYAVICIIRVVARWLIMTALIVDILVFLKHNANRKVVAGLPPLPAMSRGAFISRDIIQHVLSIRCVEIYL